MKRAFLLAACAFAVPFAIASCTSDDSSGPAPKCGGATGVPCIDGALPDSPDFTYDAPTQYADVVLPDVHVPDAGDSGQDADASGETDADSGSAADTGVDSGTDASPDVLAEDAADE